MVRSKSTVPPKVFIVVIALGVVLSGAAVLFAQTDSGVIDVAAVINESNSNNAANNEAKGTNGEGDVPKPKVRNANPDVPNGGLVGTGKQDEKRPAPEAEETTATSSDEGTATSSDQTSDDQGEKGEKKDDESDAAASTTETSAENEAENTASPEDSA